VVPAPHLAGDAYSDAPLPIGSGQTISQPYVVALMTERLMPRRTHRILEIGTGSGYQLRFSRISPKWKSVHDRAAARRCSSRPRSDSGAWDSRTSKHGWATARGMAGGSAVRRHHRRRAAPRIPEPLTMQLAPGGRLVIPSVTSRRKKLVILERPRSGADYCSITPAACASCR